MQKMFLKTELSGEYTFSGIANAAGNIDRQNDRTIPGAFTRTLREQGKRRKLLNQHNPTEPIGYVDLAEDARGNLRVTEGKLIQGVQRAEEAYLLLKAGVLDSLSIGYDVRADRIARGVRELLDVEIWEVSLVTFPANPEAVVERVKDNAPAIEALANWIHSMKNAVEAEQLRSAMQRLAAIRSIRAQVR
jgi:Escherichia/Staphylococcus phage prohead protease